MRGFVIPVSIVSLAVWLAVRGAIPVAVQDTTPVVGVDRFPITPDPADCTREQRDADELLALWYAPDGGQMVATRQRRMPPSSPSRLVRPRTRRLAPRSPTP